jgi:propionate CoA-transferase
VFRIGDDGLDLIEIAPGLDAERDVIALMGFRPRVARDLRTMDARIFSPANMGLAADVRVRPRRYRSARLEQWHESRKGMPR